MHKNRIEAFSDGVIAIIITIMVLEMKAPHAASLEALRPVWPAFLSYLMSFLYVGIYWNNHHHLFHAVRHIDGRTLWANLHLLFWLSLIPFVTSWMGESHFATLPVAAYGAVLLLAACAWMILSRVLIRRHGPASALAAAVGKDLKEKISALLYGVALALAFWRAWLACALYFIVALIWFVPDPRIERTLKNAT